MVFQQDNLRECAPRDINSIIESQTLALSQRFGGTDFSIAKYAEPARYGLKGEASVMCGGVKSDLHIICLHPQKCTGLGDSSLDQKTNLRAHPDLAHEWIIAVLPHLFVFRYSADFHEGKVPEVLHDEVQPSCWSMFKNKEDLLSGTNPVRKERDCHAMYNPTPWSQVFLIRQARVEQPLSPLDLRLVEMTLKDESGKDRYTIK